MYVGGGSFVFLCICVCVLSCALVYMHVHKHGCLTFSANGIDEGVQGRIIIYLHGWVDGWMDVLALSTV